MLPVVYLGIYYRHYLFLILCFVVFDSPGRCVSLIRFIQIAAQLFSSLFLQYDPVTRATSSLPNREFDPQQCWHVFVFFPEIRRWYKLCCRKATLNLHNIFSHLYIFSCFQIVIHCINVFFRAQSIFNKGDYSFLFKGGCAFHPWIISPWFPCLTTWVKGDKWIGMMC